MRGSGRIMIPLLAVLLIAALAGCGSEDESTREAGSTATGSTTSSVATETTTEATETVERPAKLPQGWQTSVNKAGGFSIGLPPGWSSRPSEGGQGSIIASPDELITMTITADRTSGALELPLGEFATRTAEALGSAVVGDDRFEDLFVTKPAPFSIGHGYEAAAVRASGRSARTGVKELIFVVVVRRGDLASYVVISRENAEQKSKLASRDDIKEIVRSLRGRPVS